MKLKILLSGQRVGRAWTRGATEGLGRAVREGCGLDVHIVVGGTHPDAADQPCRPGAPRVPTGSFLGISPAPPPASSWVTWTLRAAQEERRKALTRRPKQPELF